MALPARVQSVSYMAQGSAESGEKGGTPWQHRSEVNGREF